MSFLHKCLFCAPLILLSGCSFAPRYQRPPLPTAQTYPRECAKNCTNVRQLSWQDYFNDPILQQLIVLTLENNRDLRKAIDQIKEVRAIYGITWADIFPTLSATGGDLRARFPGDFSPAPTKQPFIFSAYFATLSVISWEVDFWGKLRNLKDAALEEYLSSEEAANAVFISLIQQVANTYLIERELNELISIATKTLESRGYSYHLMKRRYEEGSTSKYDLIQTETLLQQAKVDLTQLERQRELNWNAMVLLVGAPVSPDHCLLSDIEPYFIKDILPGLPSELLCNRPDVLAAEHRLKAANANIGAARAAFFPMINLTGAYGSASSELKNLFGNGRKFWTFIPFINVPIFDWGRNASNLSLAKARRNETINEYEHTIQVAFREVSDALTDRMWLGQQIAIQKEFLAAQTERARLAWIRYQYGNSPYMEFLDAERDRFSAEQSLVQTRRSYLTSGVNLYTALGGGYCR